MVGKKIFSLLGICIFFLKIPSLVTADDMYVKVTSWEEYKEAIRNEQANIAVVGDLIGNSILKMNYAAKIEGQGVKITMDAGAGIQLQSEAKVEFTGETTYQGLSGGVYGVLEVIHGGTVQIKAANFVENKVEGSKAMGGAIHYVEQKDPYSFAGNLEGIEESMFLENVVYGETLGVGGALAVGKGQIVEIRKSLFIENQAESLNTSYGGAIYNKGEVKIYDSTFLGNLVKGEMQEGVGGAIYNGAGSILHLITERGNVIFKGNSANGVANAIYNAASSLQEGATVNLQTRGSRFIYYCDSISGNPDFYSVQVVKVTSEEGVGQLLLMDTVENQTLHLISGETTLGYNNELGKTGNFEGSVVIMQGGVLSTINGNPENTMVNLRGFQGEKGQVNFVWGDQFKVQETVVKTAATPGVEIGWIDLKVEIAPGEQQLIPLLQELAHATTFTNAHKYTFYVLDDLGTVEAQIDDRVSGGLEGGYSARGKRVFSLTDHYTLNTPLNSEGMQGKELIISGHGYQLGGGYYPGLVVSGEKQQVKVYDSEIRTFNGFKGGSFEVIEGNSLLIQDSTFCYNQGNKGGAIYLANGRVDIFAVTKDSVFQENYQLEGGMQLRDIYVEQGRINFNSLKDRTIFIYGGLFSEEQGEIYKYGAGKVVLQNSAIKKFKLSEGEVDLSDSTVDFLELQGCLKASRSEVGLVGVDFSDQVEGFTRWLQLTDGTMRVEDSTLYFYTANSHFNQMSFELYNSKLLFANGLTHYGKFEVGDGELAKVFLSVGMGTAVVNQGGYWGSQGELTVAGQWVTAGGSLYWGSKSNLALGGELKIEDGVFILNNQLVNDHQHFFSQLRGHIILQSKGKLCLQSNLEGQGFGEEVEVELRGGSLQLDNGLVTKGRLGGSSGQLLIRKGSTYQPQFVAEEVQPVVQLEGELILKGVNVNLGHVENQWLAGILEMEESQVVLNGQIARGSPMLIRQIGGKLTIVEGGAVYVEGESFLSGEVVLGGGNLVLDNSKTTEIMLDLTHGNSQLKIEPGSTLAMLGGKVLDNGKLEVAKGAAWLLKGGEAKLQGLEGLQGTLQLVDGNLIFIDITALSGFAGYQQQGGSLSLINSSLSLKQQISGGKVVVDQQSQLSLTEENSFQLLGEGKLVNRGKLTLLGGNYSGELSNSGGEIVVKEGKFGLDSLALSSGTFILQGGELSFSLAEEKISLYSANAEKYFDPKGKFLLQGGSFSFTNGMVTVADPEVLKQGKVVLNDEAYLKFNAAPGSWNLLGVTFVINGKNNFIDTMNCRHRGVKMQALNVAAGSEVTFKFDMGCVNTALESDTFNLGTVSGRGIVRVEPVFGDMSCVAIPIPETQLFSGTGLTNLTLLDSEPQTIGDHTYWLRHKGGGKYQILVDNTAFTPYFEPEENTDYPPETLASTRRLVNLLIVNQLTERALAHEEKFWCAAVTNNGYLHLANKKHLASYGVDLGFRGNLSPRLKWLGFTNLTRVRLSDLPLKQSQYQLGLGLQWQQGILQHSFLGYGSLGKVKANGLTYQLSTKYTMFEHWSWLPQIAVAYNHVKADGSCRGVSVKPALGFSWQLLHLTCKGGILGEGNLYHQRKRLAPLAVKYCLGLEGQLTSKLSWHVKGEFRNGGGRVSSVAVGISYL